MSSSTKITLCSDYSQAHILQVSKMSAIILEILPFLTHSQKEEGETLDWFRSSHLKELVELLNQNGVKQYSSYIEKADSKCEKKLPSRFIITGSTLRAACVFKKRSEDDICLISKKTKGSCKKFQEFNKLSDKFIIHVCPKTNSTVMNLSQLVNTSDDADNDLISRYFQPVASH